MASMNNGACFIIGLGVGLGIGAIAVLIIKNRDRIQCEEEIESVKAAYREAFNVFPQEDPKNKDEKFVDKRSPSDYIEANRHIEYNKYASLVRDDPSKSVIIGNEYDPKPVENDDKDDDDNPFISDEEDHPSEGYPETPYVITPEEYAEDPEYSKEDLYYYVYSDTMVDDHEVEVEDIDRLIGHNNLRHMGEIEPGCLWIRSPNVMTDYQIIAIKSTWEG